MPLKGFLDAPVDHVAQQRHPLKLGLVLRMGLGAVRVAHIATDSNGAAEFVGVAKYLLPLLNEFGGF